MAPIGSASGHDGAVREVRPVEVVELFEGKHCNGKLDQAGGVEVVTRIKVIGVGSESGTILGVTVDLGVNDLKLITGTGADAGQERGGVKQAEPATSISFGASGNSAALGAISATVL